MFSVTGLSLTVLGCLLVISTDTDAKRCNSKTKLRVGEPCRNNQQCASGLCPKETGICVCPSGYMECAQVCYQTGDEAITYTQAEVKCQNQGSILATPRTSAEDKCLEDMNISANLTTYLTLGYKREGLDDPFVGADCKHLTFNDWGVGQPVNNVSDSDKNCVYQVSEEWCNSLCDTYEDTYICQLN